MLPAVCDGTTSFPISLTLATAIQICVIHFCSTLNLLQLHCLGCYCLLSLRPFSPRRSSNPPCPIGLNLLRHPYSPQLDPEFFTDSFFNLLILFIYFWLCWALAAVRAFLQLHEEGLLSSSSAWASHRGGFSCCGAQAPGHQGSVVPAPWLKSSGSIAVAHGFSFSAACGVFPNQGSNPCLLH